MSAFGACYSAAVEFLNLISKFEAEMRYLDGTGIEENDIEAARIFKNLAEKGDCGGQCMLAHCYFNARGVEEDKQEDIRLYKLSADSETGMHYMSSGTCINRVHSLRKILTKLCNCSSCRVKMVAAKPSGTGTAAQRRSGS